jgi:hypothetical protein
MMNATALNKTKESILAYIASRGPSLPVTIASELRVPPLFISAFLSELYHEEKVLMSHLKVGTTSLYLISGQEPQLENFIQHLNSREREAFHIIKQKKRVKEADLSPVHRVAIREIHDFAKPIQIEGQPAWEYMYAAPEEIPRAQLQAVAPVPEIAQQVKKIEQNIETIETEIKVQEKPKKKKAITSQKPPQDKPFSLSLSSTPFQHTQQSSPFAESVQAALEKMGCTIHALVKADKKEATFKVAMQGPHSIQSYLVIAKDKKKLKEEELQEALQEAHTQRLLCLVMARGDLDKKTAQFAASWGNFLVYKTF